MVSPKCSRSGRATLDDRVKGCSIYTKWRAAVGCTATEAPHAFAGQSNSRTGLGRGGAARVGSLAARLLPTCACVAGGCRSRPRQARRKGAASLTSAQQRAVLGGTRPGLHVSAAQARRAGECTGGSRALGPAAAGRSCRGPHGAGCSRAQCFHSARAEVGGSSGCSSCSSPSSGW